MGAPGTQTKRRAPDSRPARRRGAEPRAGSKATEKQRHKRAPKGHGGDEPKRATAQQRLIAAARDLVREHGYESLAVGEVWKRAGVSHQTFYNHFPDKRAVVCAGEHEELAVIDAAIRRAQAQGEPWVGELARSLDRALADLHGSQDTPRARLVAAMTKIAATDGIKAASVHALARTARVSAGEFQHYFSGRRDCLGAAVAQAIGRLEERLEATPEADDPLASATRLLEALIDSLAADPHIATLLLGEAGVLSAPPHHQRRGEADGPRGWAGSLRELVEARVLAPLAKAPEPQRRFAAGAIVAALRAVHRARGREGLRRAVAEITAAGLAPLAVTGEARAPAGASRVG